MEAVSLSIKDADIFLILMDISSDPEGKKILEDDYVKEILKGNKKPLILIINKIDLSSQEFVQNLIEKIQQKYRLHSK